MLRNWSFILAPFDFRFPNIRECFELKKQHIYIRIEKNIFIVKPKSYLILRR